MAAARAGMEPSFSVSGETKMRGRQFFVKNREILDKFGG
jgi:hypothetical protein